MHPVCRRKDKASHSIYTSVDKIIQNNTKGIDMSPFYTPPGNKQKWQAYIRSVLYQNLKQCLTTIATLAAADPLWFPPCYGIQSDFS